MILALYNPEWPTEFAALRAVYMGSLGELILRVEHVGSTAVPNLRAKPILDIDIVMPGYEVFPDIKEIECRDFVESVLTANLESDQAQDTARVT